MKREGKDIFGELLRVLGKGQEDDQDLGVKDEVGIFCSSLAIIFLLMYKLSSAAYSVVTLSPPKRKRVNTCR